MKDNVIQKKSFNFALKVIDIYKFLVNEKREYILSKQLLKSATSIGANVEEAIGGQTKRDFITKISIAYKESREAKYWIKLIRYSNIIDKEVYNDMIYQIEEICKILSSIIITTKRRIYS